MSALTPATDPFWWLDVVADAYIQPPEQDGVAR